MARYLLTITKTSSNRVFFDLIIMTNTFYCHVYMVSNNISLESLVHKFSDAL